MQQQLPLLREVVLAALPALGALRSATARLAAALCHEALLLPAPHHPSSRPPPRPLLDADAPAIVAALLPLALRDAFLSRDADAALAAACMAGGLSPARAAAALLSPAGVGSHAPAVRAKAALHLDALVTVWSCGGRGGGGPLFLGDKQLQARLFAAAAALCADASAEARAHGRRLLCAVAGGAGGSGATPSSAQQQRRLLAALRPEALRARAVETLAWAADGGGGLSLSPPPALAALLSELEGGAGFLGAGAAATTTTTTRGEQRTKRARPHPPSSSQPRQ